MKRQLEARVEQQPTRSTLSRAQRNHLSTRSVGSSASRRMQ